ncbi:MAG TPA: hypothetical protein VM889_01105 [Candidatus Thermoplasmatota archaeon]|nr:hypothetical protein [Candidatus Thermoplasmatota archaeon]
MFAAGDDVLVRATGERGTVVLALDAAGTLLVAVGDETLAFAAGDLERPWARQARCC